MVTVHQIKANGYYGGSKEVDPREGVSANWTYTAPPDDGVWLWQDGAWVAAEYEPVVLAPGVLVNVAAEAESVRQQRNDLLATCDWTQVADAPVDKDAWAAYRQALRDITGQEGFPLSIDWPVAP